MKKMSSDNRGLSLIELLVAIVVLGIVCIPLITTFVNSAKINRNAQRVHSASTLAQSIMEYYKSTDWKTLIAADASGASVSVNMAALNDAQKQTVSENQAAFTPYIFYQTGLTADNGHKYDARITMDPRPYSQFGTVSGGGVSGASVSDASDINIAQIPSLPAVDNATSPVIANQIIAQDRDSLGNDPVAKKIYSLLGQYTQAELSTIGINSWTDVSNRLQKEIVVTVDTATMGTNTGSVYVHCDLHYTYPTPDGDKVYIQNVYQERYSMQKEDASDTDDASDAGIDGRISVYLFWTPSPYNAGKDNITIINTTGCRINFYLVKQESMMGVGNTIMLKNSSTDSGERFMPATAHEDGRMCERNVNLITNLTDSSKLYDMNSKLRCYEVKVELFEANGVDVYDLDSNAQVTTVTSTKEVYQ